MSLLMKALEKAAKDRGDSRSSDPADAPDAAAPASELSLEPLAAETSEAPEPERATATREQAQAATVLQAARKPAAGGVGAYARAHPMAMFGVLAALFVAGFGIYFYLQIAHPGLFAPQPPAPKAPLTPFAQAPGGPAPGAALSASPATPAPIPAAALLQDKAAAVSPPAAAAPVTRAKPRPAAPAAESVGAPSDSIVVSRGSGQEPALNPLLTEAYDAFRTNQLEQAQALYTRLLQVEPRNIDALLGLAAIAALGGKTDEATAYYLRILELDPRHPLAQSGLISLLGRADPIAAESKLKQLIAREPSPHLFFTLGNLYADQSQWAAAQHAFFQAHHLEPANPDYAYNLAVGLEHVSQHKLALGFYRRAVQLTAAKGRTNFNLAQAQERISRLAAQVE